MKGIRISGVISLICFAALSYFYFLFYGSFVEIGSKAIWMFNKNYYSDIGIYFYENDYVISPSAETSTDYEYEQMCQFKERLDKAGVKLLYVNKPTKYVDDSIFESFGVESYCNRNADKFLARIEEAGIDTLDLREEIEKDGLDIYSMFYRTDHHWTVPAGKWGAMKIAQALNEKCGYDIDLSIYDDENYNFITTKEAWFGEQGAKLEGAPIKKDDYTIITPKFDTSYNMGESTYTFNEAFINNLNGVGHYNYMSRGCTNNNVKEGSVLIIGDSYDVVTEPFLSLAVHMTDRAVLREGSINKVLADIDEGKYDTVIVCYAPFMIGAHDDETSANYAMFSLNG